MIRRPPSSSLFPCSTLFRSNFMRGTALLAQARATALTGGTTLTVPFPTPATAITPNLPGLSAGPVQAQVWQQTGSAPTFSLNVGTAHACTQTPPAPGVTATTPNTIDVATPPASFTITGNGFANLGFGLPVVNFIFFFNDTATTEIYTLSLHDALPISFPTPATAITPNLPGLSAGPVQAQVWQQTGSAPTFSLKVGRAPWGARVQTSPGAGSLKQRTIDVATPPASFTITGNGFANRGFGLPVVNFMRGTTLLAQARATALAGGTTLTVPFPTPATAITPNLPGLSAGPVQAQVWQQTGSAPTFSLIGSAALTVTVTVPGV